MARYILYLLLLSTFSCSQQQYENPHVIISTRIGDIEVELFKNKAPQTTAAFLALIDSGYYAGSSFYRVLKADELPSDYNSGIIQGGLWKTSPGKMEGLPFIGHESTRLTGLLHKNGTISMARTDTGTARSEFFICIGDQGSFDYGKRGTADGQGFAAFGMVFRGMDIVRKIQAKPSHGDSFDQAVEILDIKKL